MPSDLSEYINVPISNDTTPLKIRNPAIEKLNKKRGPSTPLTPTLIQKNIIKKQLTSFPISVNNFSGKDDEMIIYDDNKEQQLNGNDINDELAQQENEENYMFIQQSGSPVSKNFTPTNNKLNISNGIKQIVKEQKKTRLQMLKSESRNEDKSFSENEYSEVSTIGDTPNYKLQSDLVYYKNGYYMNGDDSFEKEKESIIAEKELIRVNDLLDFMKLEREFNK